MERKFSGEYSLQMDFDKYLVLYQFFDKHQLFVGRLNAMLLLIYNFYNTALFSRWFSDSVILTYSFIL